MARRRSAVRSRLAPPFPLFVQLADLKACREGSSERFQLFHPLFLLVYQKQNQIWTGAKIKYERDDMPTITNDSDDSDDDDIDLNNL